LLPSFLSLNGGVAGAPVEVPPPHGFRSVDGPVFDVGMGSFVLPSGALTAAQKAGLRYEDRIQEALSRRFTDLFQSNVRLFYRDGRGPGGCIFDGLLMAGKSVTIIEIKLQHMPEAWWQLRKKYEPVVRAWPVLEGRRVYLLEICRSLDASMPFPEPLNVVQSIDELLMKEDGTLGVLQWKL
jgi:hypothetical protein